MPPTYAEAVFKILHSIVQAYKKLSPSEIIFSKGDILLPGFGIGAAYGRFFPRKPSAASDEVLGLKVSIDPKEFFEFGKKLAELKKSDKSTPALSEYRKEGKIVSFLSRVYEEDMSVPGASVSIGYSASRAKKCRARFEGLPEPGNYQSIPASEFEKVKASNEYPVPIRFGGEGGPRVGREGNGLKVILHHKYLFGSAKSEASIASAGEYVFLKVADGDFTTIHIFKTVQ